MAQKHEQPRPPLAFEEWPALPFEEWKDTRDTLHMWTQIVGKTRLELCPEENHWWQVTLYVTPRGLTTSPVPYGSNIFDAEFDFIDHVLRIRTSAGGLRTLSLTPRTVADFYAEYLKALHELGVNVAIRHPQPDEVLDPIPFAEDRVHSSYDRDAAHRFWIALVNADRIMKKFRGRFLGKSSPVHFFWGSFDIAVTRFSGRRAPSRPGADPITRKAYSHEVISGGFWPGDTRFPHAAFYAYAAPAPAGFEKEVIRPEAAFYSLKLGEFLLKYDDARAAASPDDAVLDFLQSTYEAGARLAGWDRAALEAVAATASGG
ncbi:MAG TPA: DUF5996 family protein [Bryobacteraceae bacterium]|jgi:hypothetical protein